MPTVTFAPKTEFFDVEGIPVTINAGPEATPNMLCAAWDKHAPRVFPYDSAVRNGALIPRLQFEQLVASFKAS